MRRGRGFTLVEVMVALAVVALALPALLFSLNQLVDGTGYLRDKSLANMVAANKLEEIRILALSRGSLLKGKDSGVARMAERDWYWWVDSTATEVDQFYRIEISVAAEETQQDQPLHRLSAFMSADLRLEEEVQPDDEGELVVGSGTGAGGGGTDTGTTSRADNAADAGADTGADAGRPNR